MPLNIMRLIPFSSLIPVAMILLIIGYVAGHIVGTNDANTDWQAKWNAETAHHATALAVASERQRDIERKYQDELEAITHATQQKLNAAAADVDAANAESDRLRNTATELAKRAGSTCQRTAAATGSDANSTAAVVLADVLSRIDARAGELAAAADRAHAAGLACQQAYTAIREGQRE